MVPIRTVLAPVARALSCESDLQAPWFATVKAEVDLIDGRPVSCCLDQKSTGRFILALMFYARGNPWVCETPTTRRRFYLRKNESTPSWVTQ